MSAARLPPRPSITYLRRLGKKLLVAVRSGNQQALSRVHKFFPDAMQRGLAEPSKADFGLRDALFVIAREYGFSSWPKLKDHVTTNTFGELSMSNPNDQIDENEEGSPSNWYCRTVFFVQDVEKSVDFYQRRLGFSHKWNHEDMAAQVARNGLEIILFKDAGKSGKGRIFMSLGAGQVRKLEKEFEATGLEVSFREWGMNVMTVADDVGNELYFYDDELGG